MRSVPSTSAPEFRRISAMLMWPFLAAQIRPVSPWLSRVSGDIPSWRSCSSGSEKSVNPRPHESVRFVVADFL